MDAMAQHLAARIAVNGRRTDLETIAATHGPCPCRQPQDLWAWTQRAMEDAVPMEIRSFAEGLERDAASVEAAVKLKWNNGRAEGHVNRIKLIKRKMYGRAKFDLLGIRVLARS